MHNIEWNIASAFQDVQKRHLHRCISAAWESTLTLESNPPLTNNPVSTGYQQTAVTMSLWAEG